MSETQKKIFELFKLQDTYDNPQWRFSALGFREVSRILNIPTISASNAMRSMLNKGIFNQSSCKDRWSDTIYYLNNPKIKK